ncbi:MAG: nucleoside hydrolase [bacterium]
MIYNNYEFKVPKEKLVRVITDTDAKNEADDHYAIVQALLSPKFDNIGVIGAHFGKERIENSMEASYQEILRILDLMEFDNSIAYRGAEFSLKDEKTPVVSEGAELIISEAMKDDYRPLYVTFLGPLTDLASAILMEPRIQGRLIAIWIGGGAYPNGGREYNLSNDINAANVVMKSEIDLWQIPQNVYQYVLVSLAELESKVKPHGKLGEYLFNQLVEHALTPAAVRSQLRTGEAWVLGDSPAVGVILAKHDFRCHMRPAPEITSDMYYVDKGNNRPIKVYDYVDSRFILEDFYAKLKFFSQNK